MAVDAGGDSEARACELVHGKWAGSAQLCVPRPPSFTFGQIPLV